MSALVRRQIRQPLATALTLLLAMQVCHRASAEVRLPALFSDNVVLQRDLPLPVWGWADPGEQVEVSLRGLSRVAIADREGRWRVTFAGMAAGGPFDMTVTGNGTSEKKDTAKKITISNVLFGDVWVCSGQSNMEVPIRDALNPEHEISTADYPEIRFFKVRGRASLRPLEDVERMDGHGLGLWVPCSPQSVKQFPFSAVGYFFGRELQRKLKVPIGLVDCCWGGTAAECWVNLELLKTDPDYKPSVDWVENLIADHPDILDDFEPYYLRWGETWGVWWKAYQEWEKDGNAAGKPRPSDAHLGALPGNPLTHTGAYNAMLRPLIPFGIRGVTWYQGESNTGKYKAYRKLFPALINFWRKEWNQGNFPFLFVQLASYELDSMKPDYLLNESVDGMSRDPTDHDWARLREVQLDTLDVVPNTRMAVAVDVGDRVNVHPTNKQAVGKRLALAALARVHGQDVIYSGPIYSSMEKTDSTIRLRFKHVGGGLVARGGDARGFAIAGEDQKFFWATARIVGDAVVVESEKVSDPVAVRYAWDDDPVSSLYNKAGLPASPFRTDDWPLMVQDSVVETKTPEQEKRDKAPVSMGDTARLQHVLAKARRGEPIVVGAIGGSITAGAMAAKGEDRFPDRVAQWWRDTFPGLEVTLVNAGIGATGSDTGAHRVKRDLLENNPDFVVVEFAVNDTINPHAARTLEGMLRQILRHSNEPAVMMLFMMDEGGGSKQAVHTPIGEHYGLPMVSYRDALWPDLESGRLTWKDLSPDTVHPNSRGHGYCADYITEVLERVRSDLPPDLQLPLRNSLPKPLESDTFETTAVYGFQNLTPTRNDGWKESNRPNSGAGWEAHVPGSFIEFEVEGTAISLIHLRTKGDRGMAEAWVDDRDPVKLDAWFVPDWKFAAFELIADGLEPGKHRLRIRILDENNEASGGHKFEIHSVLTAGLADG
jgi:sialate O-acetylesterase